MSRFVPQSTSAVIHPRQGGFKNCPCPIRQLIPKQKVEPTNAVELLSYREWSGGQAVFVEIKDTGLPHCLTVNWSMKEADQKYRIALSLGLIDAETLKALGEMLIDCAAMAENWQVSNGQ